MSKKVPVFFGERRWLVSYDTTAQSNEYLAFQVALMDIVECDPFLVRMLDTHFPVVVYFDHEFKELCELHSACQMPPPDCTLWLKFIARWDDEELDHFIATKVVPPNAAHFDKEKAAAVEAEAAKARLRDLEKEIHFDGKIASEEKKFEISKSPVKNNKGSGKKRRCPDEKFANVEFQSDAALPSSKLRKKCALELPVFSSPVQQVINRGELKLSYFDFIDEASEHLLSVKEKPKTYDYKMYCTALVQKYPELKAHNKPTGKEHETLKELLMKAVKEKRKNKPKSSRKVKKRPARAQNSDSLDEPPAGKSLRVKPVRNYSEPLSSPEPTEEDTPEESNADLQFVKIEF